MAAVPLYGHVRGDFVSVLVPVEDEDTMDVVADKIAFHVIGKRLPSRDAALKVNYNGDLVTGDTTVSAAGIGPLDWIEVFYDE